MPVATDEAYREFARRQHRMLATYAALKAWELGVECVWVERENLVTFLDIGQFREARIEWLKADVKHLFRHVTDYGRKNDKVSDIAFSRVAIPDEFWRMQTARNSVKLPLPKHGFTEAAITSILHRLSIGLPEKE